MPPKKSVREISVNFEGYWPESDFQHVPNYMGIYCIFAAGHPIVPRKFLYIGKGDNIFKRVNPPHQHHAYECWKVHLKQNESIACSTAQVAEVIPKGFVHTDLQVVERALIHKYEPPCNKRFEWLEADETKLFFSGKIDLLDSQITLVHDMGHIS